jgi:hypothetical protein
LPKKDGGSRGGLARTEAALLVCGRDNHLAHAAIRRRLDLRATHLGVQSTMLVRARTLHARDAAGRRTRLRMVEPWLCARAAS